MLLWLPLPGGRTRQLSGDLVVVDDGDQDDDDDDEASLARREDQTALR